MKTRDAIDSHSNSTLTALPQYQLYFNSEFHILQVYLAIRFWEITWKYASNY